MPVQEVADSREGLLRGRQVIQPELEEGLARFMFVAGLLGVGSFFADAVFADLTTATEGFLTSVADLAVATFRGGGATIGAGSIVATTLLTTSPNSASRRPATRAASYPKDRM